MLTRGVSQLYLSLGDAGADGSIAVRLYHKPLVLLIWLGPVVMVLGGGAVAVRPAAAGRCAASGAQVRIAAGGVGQHGWTMTIHEWMMIAVILFAVGIGLFRLNSTIAVALLFCVAFTYWNGVGHLQSWSVATVPVLGIVLGLILTGIYYLVRRYSPWRKAAANPPS